MADAAPTKPVLNQSDLADIQMFVYGYQKWQQDQPAGPDGKPAPQGDQAAAWKPSPEVMKTAHPFTVDKVCDLLDKSLNMRDGEDVINAHGMSVDQLDKLSDKLKTVGMENILDDGKVSTEEYFAAGGALGQALMQKDPDKYNPSEADMDKVRELMKKHGIDNPSDYEVKGVAVCLERSVDRVNKGLGVDMGPKADVDATAAPKPDDPAKPDNDPSAVTGVKTGDVAPPAPPAGP